MKKLILGTVAGIVLVLVATAVYAFLVVLPGSYDNDTPQDPAPIQQADPLPQEPLTLPEGVTLPSTNTVDGNVILMNPDADGTTYITVP